MKLAKLFTALLTLALFCSPVVLAAEELPVLSVDGQGSAAVVPDQAVLTLGVTSQARSANQAQAENAQKSMAITQALKQMGVAGADIKSQQYSFHPNYSNEEKRGREISSYTASHSLRVNIRDIAKAGRIIDAALNAGANEVNSLQFSLSNQSAARKEALGAAIADARNKADIIAQGLGRQIVGIKNVSESTDYIEARSYDRNMLLASKAAATNIEPGTLDFNARVHIEYLLSK